MTKGLLGREPTRPFGSVGAEQVLADVLDQCPSTHGWWGAAVSASGGGCALMTVTILCVGGRRGGGLG